MVSEKGMSFGAGLAWKCVIGDISNNYTELDHAAIAEAVRWGLEKNRLCSRFDRVAVDRRSRKCHQGRAWGVGGITIRLDTILEVSTFDNDNIFLWLSDGESSLSPVGETSPCSMLQWR